MEGQIKNLIEQLYKFHPQLIGAGYDNCLNYLKELIGLDIIEFPSGTQFETWIVPDEWVIKEAWVKDPKGDKIIEWNNDLSVMNYSRPVHKKVDRKELKKHLYTLKDRPDAIPYEFCFYSDNWGFSMPYNKIYDKDEKDLLEEGEYEVFIDSELKPGILKIGIHTIKGKSDREILLFAHLDHPYQANDNLSGVACLADLAVKMKPKCKKHNIIANKSGSLDKNKSWYGIKYECSKCLLEFCQQEVELPEHTIKIIFCPETIGSIAYACTQDISKVDFMIAVDAIGSDTQPTFQWSFDGDDRINRIAHLAFMMGDESFNMDRFRAYLGSDEYVFNDPKIGIPGLFITRAPYPEYHSCDDKPEIINELSITRIQDAIKNIIEIYEADFIPVRNFKAPLFRTKYNAQTPVKGINKQLDYFIYNINGILYLSEIIDNHQLNWRFCYDLVQKLLKDGLIQNANRTRKVGRTKRNNKNSK